MSINFETNEINDTNETNGTNETNELSRITYDKREYFLPYNSAMKIGFINGMIDSGLYDNLALPVHTNPIITGYGHKLLKYMTSNPSANINYLQANILGVLNYKDCVQRLDISNVAGIRSILEQVFSLLALADYWDCQDIINDCTDFLGLLLSKSDQQSVSDWFEGIV